MSSQLSVKLWEIDDNLLLLDGLSELIEQDLAILVLVQDVVQVFDLVFVVFKTDKIN